MTLYYTISAIAIVAAIYTIYSFGHRHGNIKMIEWENDNIFCNDSDVD